MDTILIFFLLAFVGAIVLNGMQPPEPPTIVYVPVETSRSHGNGCIAVFLLLAAILFGLLLLGR